MNKVHPQDVFDSGVKLQSHFLGLLLAEMQALARLMPPTTIALTIPGAESETEAEFDNMPV